MFGFLLLLFICVPILEIWLLIRIGQAIEAGPTIALVILTGVLGAALARREGARTLLRIRETMARGEVPALAMVEGVMIFAAGLLLVTPGVITDCVGFATLVPPVRRWMARKLADYFRARVVVSGHTLHMNVGEFYDAGPDAPPARDDIIDVEYRDVTDEKTQRLQESRDGE
jgi:UPF0716 protein FxsA